MPLPISAAEQEAGTEVEVILQVQDVVVITQSCDIAKPACEDVLVCPHYGAEAAGVSKKELQEIAKGRRWRNYVLPACDEGGLSMDVRVVDFGRVFTLPKHIVQDYAARQSPRLRIRSPFREHLSQAFGFCFMRIGLPDGEAVAEILAARKAARS